MATTAATGSQTLLSCRRSGRPLSPAPARSRRFPAAVSATARRSRVQSAPRNPRLLMLAGLPGCGKSRFAREVSLRCPFLVLESDRLRKALVGAPEYTPGENGRVFRACHRLIDEFLGLGYPVLFDATNLTVRNRRPVCAIARKRGVPLAVAVATAPLESRPRASAGARGGPGSCHLVGCRVGHLLPHGPGLGASETPPHHGGHFPGHKSRASAGVGLSGGVPR